MLIKNYLSECLEDKLASCGTTQQLLSCLCDEFDKFKILVAKLKLVYGHLDNYNQQRGKLKIVRSCVLKFKEKAFQTVSNELEISLEKLKQKRDKNNEEEELLCRVTEIYTELVCTNPALKQSKRENDITYYKLVGDINKRDKFCC